MHLTPDILIIGGGPAGSTAAALLVKQGYSVTLLEKDHHPRFHIGESLLPMNLKIFEKLGVLDDVHAIGVLKKGASFISEEYQKTHTFYFDRSLEKNHGYAYQVKRSEFDHLLFKHAQKQGATTLEGVKVTRVQFSQDKQQVESVEAESEQGEKYHFTPRFVVDATGRDTLFSSALQLKLRNPHNNSAAIFGHFSGLKEMPDDDEGNIRVHLADQGWMWMIPLQHGITSVGIVATPEYLKERKGSLEEFFWDHCKRHAKVWERMEHAKGVGEVQATGNFSYFSKEMYGKNYMMIGDAFGFIDPVFSTGVLFAMTSGTKASELIHTALQHPQKRERVFAAFRNETDRTMKRVSWFIYHINCPVFRDMMVHPRNILKLENAVISLLAGDFREKFSLSWPLLLFKGIYTMKKRLGV
ncbi:MAG: NAD(P)/FAD-dependent oxidoreductase [Rickettsiales bacterium]|jgi:geranylgeranyl reductase family protein|nr:NAD(P)/FAD-dependent oxidoreductase [Rickettsiales bacterium]